MEYKAFQEKHEIIYQVQKPGDDDWIPAKNAKFKTAGEAFTMEHVLQKQTGIVHRVVKITHIIEAIVPDISTK